MSARAEDLRDAKNAFQELLLLGGGAAAHAESVTHRGSYATSAERWGLEYWANILPERDIALANSIIAAIIALSLSETDQQRMAMAAALRTLVAAARAPSIAKRARPIAVEPRRWWIEGDR